MDNDTFDFGFSLVNEDELKVVEDATKAVQTSAEEIETLQKRLDTIYNMIQPLLNNLASGTDRDYIHWPAATRLQKIEEFSDKLRNVYLNGGT